MWVLRCRKRAGAKGHEGGLQIPASPVSTHCSERWGDTKREPGPGLLPPGGRTAVGVTLGVHRRFCYLFWTPYEGCLQSWGAEG